MIRHKLWMAGVLLAALAGLGCHHSSSITITITPTAATVLINNSVQFSPTVTGSSNAVTWQVNGVTGGTASTACGPGSTSPSTVCYGTISTSGLYVAPATVPTNPAVTITAIVSGTSTTATATVNIISGVQVTINNPITTIGTGESYTFSATTSGVPSSASLPASGSSPGCTATADKGESGLPPNTIFCDAVTWSVNSAGGSTCSATNPQPGCNMNPTTGAYTAPNATTNGISVLVTATSVFDPNATAAALVNLVVATDPTLISIGPNAGARGSLFQDVYLSGTNFISTTNVFVNGVEVPPVDVSVSSVTCSVLTTTNTSGTSEPVPPCTSASLSQGATVMRVRVTSGFLANSFPTLPSTDDVQLAFTVARQAGSQIQCSPNPSACQLVLSPVRPSIVGVNPDTVVSPSGGFQFTLDGGYYGAASGCNGSMISAPLVTAQFNGQPVPSFVDCPETQLQVTPGSAFGPGLYEASVFSDDTSGISPATTNVAIQPQYTSSTTFTPTPVTVGTMPSAVAIDTSTGYAYVTNQGSNDLYAINLSTQKVTGMVCTAGGSEPTCTASTPTSVAVDNNLHIALVTNSALGTLSVISLANPAQPTLSSTINLTSILNAADNQNPANVSQVPVAVGINPVLSRALVAFRGAYFGLIIDETQLAACATSPSSCIAGMTSITTGTNPRVAVSPNLNWALVTPGGLGTISIVNLSQQDTNPITALTRSAGTVTVTTATTTALVVGEPVLIENVSSDPTFNGLYVVQTVPTSNTFTYVQLSSLPNSSVSGSANSTVYYGNPVTTVNTTNTVTGVAINDITSNAILADPGSLSGAVEIFNILNQSTTAPSNASTIFPPSGMIGAAFDPLLNLAMTVNQTNNTAYVISTIQGGQNSTPGVPANFQTDPAPWDVAIDPGTSTAVVITQGGGTSSPSKADIVQLTPPNTPQILQVTATCGGAACGPGPDQIYVPSTLGSAPTPNNVTLTIIGTGFFSGATVRVDGQTLSTMPPSANGRVIQAVLPASMQMTPHRYALDVASNSGSSISNELPLSVVEAISVSNSSCSSAPTPMGVAVDSSNNVAVVSDIACSAAYLINLGTYAEQTVPVGTSPLGVAVMPQGGVALVANSGSGSDSVTLLNDVTGAEIGSAISVESDPSGVAIDPVLGQAVVTANGANDMDTFPIYSNPVSGATAETYTATPVGEGPVPVAVDYEDHIAAIGNEAGNSVSLMPLAAGNFSQQTLSASLPTSIAYDPVNDDFLIASSLSDQISIVNPLTLQSTPVSVGIDPTSIAYNFQNGTLVTTNTLGGNMTVVDLVTQAVRAVFPMTSSTEFAVDIDSISNIAVVADGANSRILLLQLP